MNHFDVIIAYWLRRGEHRYIYKETFTHPHSFVSILGQQLNMADYNKTNI